MNERIRSIEKSQLDKRSTAYKRESPPPTDGRDADVYDFNTGKKMTPEIIIAHEKKINEARKSAIEKAERRIIDTDVTIMMERLAQDEIENKEILRCVDAFRSSPSNVEEEDVQKIISALVAFDLVDFSPDDYKTANDSRRLLGLRKSARQSMRAEIERNIVNLEHLLKI